MSVKRRVHKHWNSVHVFFLLSLSYTVFQPQALELSARKVAAASGDMRKGLGICRAPIGQGYGLTETCAGAAFSEADDNAVGRVGPPLSCVYIKLVSWDEGGYLTSDKPLPRGELVVGGFSVTAGYFNNEEKTNEVYLLTALKWMGLHMLKIFLENPSTKEVTKREVNKGWKNWKWRTSRDVFMDGAYFIPSGYGSCSPGYTRAQSFSVAHGSQVPALTANAGPLRCTYNRAC